MKNTYIGFGKKNYKSAPEEKPKITNQSFTKNDVEKPKWNLLPWAELESVVKTFNIGAEKYSEHNWKNCDDPKRYIDAAIRHLVKELQWINSKQAQEAGITGVSLDNESGFPSVSHAIASLLIYHALINENSP